MKPHCQFAVRLAFILALFCLCGCGEKREETVELGYVGRARLDPFLAASYFIEESGRPARSQRLMPEDLDSRIGLLVCPGHVVAPQSRFREVLDWVTNGGCVVICIDGAESYSDYPVPMQRPVAADEIEAIGERLERIGVELELRDFWHNEIETLPPPGIEIQAAEDAGYEVQVGGNVRLAAAGIPGEGGESSGFAALPYGRGTLAVLGHARPWRNRYLQDHDHAALLAQLNQMAPAEGEAVFVFGSTGTFFALLWERAWRPLVAALILLGFWIWRSGGRFGPVLEPEDRGHQMIRYQLQQSGGFFRKAGQTAELLNSARERVRSLAVRAQPHWEKLDNDAKVDELARRTGMKPGPIRDALVGIPESPNKGSFSSRMRTLQKLQKKLRPSKKALPGPRKP